jgi:hypothetical protein
LFLENDFARPLFDFEKGGPPKAFQCLMGKTTEGALHFCGKVTRTERGMRMHLKYVHDWEEQACLYSTEPQKDQNPGAPRKLRAGRLSFPSEKLDQQDTEKTPLSNKKSQEMNAQESLPLTKEES